MVAESSNMDSTAPPDDLTTVMFRDDNYIGRFGLNEENAFEYFAMSQFYDPRCNNQKIRMQNLDPSILTTMAGIEYSVKTSAPNLYIVSKSLRTITPPGTELLANYYIFYGNIYQVPTMHAILSSRMLQTVHYIRNAYDSIRNAVALAPSGSYVWDPSPQPLDDPDPPSSTRTRLVDPQNAARQPTAAETSAVDQVLYDVLLKNRRLAAAHEAAQNKAAAPTAGPAPPAPPQPQ